MAILDGNLWEHNMAKVVVIDVTDDYCLMKPPLPSECYPVLTEIWVPVQGIRRRLADTTFVEGYLYDWHETPDNESGTWYVGVVNRSMVGSEGHG